MQKGAGFKLNAAIAIAMVMLTAAALLQWAPAAAASIADRLTLPDDVRAIVEANRPVPTLVTPEELEAELSSLLYRYSDFNDEAPANVIRYGVESLKDAETAKTHISPNEAMEDVDLLFRVFKYGYAGYQFFGGDEAFGKARSRIMERVRACQNAISVDELADVIADNLDFIQDGHFYVGGRKLCRVSRFCADFSREFRMDGAGRFKSPEGPILVVADGRDPAQYMKPSLSVDGDIVCILGTLAPDGSSGTDVLLEFDDGTKQVATLNAAMTESNRPEGPCYELTETAGIPMAVCRQLGSFRGEDEYMNRFVSDAEKLWYEDVVLIDLRSNPGGSSSYPSSWCEILTLRHPKSLSATVELRTATSAALSESAALLAGRQLGNGVWRRPSDEKRPGWSTFQFAYERYASDKPLLVVLMDCFSASASEYFVGSLRYMDNVVFVGTNTSVAYLTGNVMPLNLPHSSLRVQVTTMLKLEADTKNIDGVGFMPDFWVAPENAVDRAVAFVRKHILVEH